MKQQNQIVEDAVELMSQIEGVASSVNTLSLEEEGCRTEIRGIESDIETRKLAVTDETVKGAGGFKSLGSNEKERSHRLDMAHLNDRELQVLNAKLTTYQGALAQAETERKNASRHFTALQYIASLSTALLRYYAAGQAGEPDNEINEDALRFLGL